MREQSQEVSTQMAMLVMELSSVVQATQLLNHSSEERSSGFQMLKTLKTGEFSK